MDTVFSSICAAFYEMQGSCKSEFVLCCFGGAEFENINLSEFTLWEKEGLKGIPFFGVSAD